MSLSIYIHVPFCLKKCFYCDFASVCPETIPESEYTAAVITEIETVTSKLYDGRVPVKSIYFGGGTPSLFSPENIGRVIKKVREKFEVKTDAEVTLEVNPKTADYDKLTGYRDIGVNRLSIGVQSFDEGMLDLLGRVHGADDALKVYGDARRAGFSNINLDLIFGMPTQTAGMLEDDLKRLVELNPEHISAYILTVERGTPLYEKIVAGVLPAPDDDLVTDMFGIVEESLTQNGYKHYEISAYSKPGRESVHNVNYWRYGSYIGFGAAAHSFIKDNGRVRNILLSDYGKEDKYETARWCNVKSYENYIKKVTEERSAFLKVEPITEGMRMTEYLMMGMRLLDGIDLNAFKDEFGRELTEVFENGVKLLTERNMIEIKNNRLKLTQNGVLLSNEVLINLVT